MEKLTRQGFTMAEILLSLTIIGVVAAITLPSLTGNINERTWNTQRKALYSRISQAVSLMPALNGYGQIKAESSEGAGDAVDTAAETFITSGLSKVLKINNICSNDHYSDCGFVSEFTNATGTKILTPIKLHSLTSNFSLTTYEGKSYSANNSNAVAFETQNGESIVAYYNHNCITEYLNETGALTPGGNIFGFPEATMCLNLFYDLNGKKGPNTVGKDMGIITVFNASDPIVVAPRPIINTYTSGVSWNNASKTCTEKNSDSRLPNIHEASSMLVNKKLLNLSNGNFLSSSVFNNEKVWAVNSALGIRHTIDKTQADAALFCVER